MRNVKSMLLAAALVLVTACGDKQAQQFEEAAPADLDAYAMDATGA